MVSSLLLVFAAAVAAFAVSAMSGGGAGLVLLPVLRMVLPAAMVPAALSIGSTISSASRITLFFKHIRWRVVRWFVPAALPFVWLGAWLLTYIDPVYLEAVLGLFLLANLPMLFRRQSEPSDERPGPVWALCIVGAAAGFISGLTGAVGLIFNRFYLRYGLSKDEIVATRAANEIILHLIKLVLYGLFGLLTGDVLTVGAIVGAAALSATWLTRRVLPYLSEAMFKRIGYAAMVLSGAIMSTNAGGAIATRHGIGLQATGTKNGFHGYLDWADSRVTLEFAYDEGFEIETVIDWDDLPDDRKAVAAGLIEAADRIMVEEVRSIGRRSYELYVYRGGVLSKHEL
ncbi:hypothetical protein EC912_106192 [Luteibacter rhizovicinus]|uniref:Probable membrane transporter protein n=1 Tax=Luteibacter rhizovicinus TaxID=242606 RepID=A0A4R3YPL1_9GAMM|nr:sulfite exporter TauE/SafE family protein [Luteibacter rhizovicinus]TCV92853.1 hypothetical protein EC912_106192 [Luteibacter rhizovicinus]